MSQIPTDKCPRCSAPRNGDYKFCPQCGANYDALLRVKQARPQKQSLQRRRWEYAAIIGVVVVVAVAYNVYVAAKKNTVPVSTPAPVNQSLQSTTTPVGNSFDEIVKSGHSFMDNGAYPMAIQQYERALAIDSLHPDIMVDLGACYHGIGEDEEAVFHFKRALALEPNHLIATYNMGVVALGVADTAGAKLWWGKYLEMAPNSPQAETLRKQLQSM